jgi:hypothetical protein
MTNAMSTAGPSQLPAYPFKPFPPPSSGRGEKVATELKQLLSGTSANVFSRKEEQYVNHALPCT